MEQYNVTGMSCAACSARVEKAVSKVPGVTSCSVSLLTNSMGVEGSASPEAVIAAVTEAGYGAALKGTEGKKRKRSFRIRVHAEGYGDTKDEKKTSCFRLPSASADVFFHGSYDVGLAFAAFL